MIDIPMWHCATCDVYFFRLATWSSPKKHFPSHRPGNTHPLFHHAGVMCLGTARIVTEGPELAAYLMGGPDAVWAMGRKIN